MSDAASAKARGAAAVALAALAAAVTSCLVSCDGEAASAEAARPAEKATRPNYNEDVYPVLAAHCFRCHDGGSALAGVVLDDYAGAASAAFHLRHVVVNREMPPWGTDDSGRCSDFEGARWLHADEITAVVDWLDHGLPEGDVAQRQAPRSRPLPVPLEGATAITVGAGYAPAPGAGTSRCFVVDAPAAADRFVTGMSFDFPSGVLQATLFALDTDDAAARAAALDGADAEPGYPCVGGGAAASARFVLGVTGASALMRLPEGTGVKIAGGRPLVVQLDYDLFARATAATIDLQVATAAREGRWTEVRAPSLSLPPNEGDTSVQFTYVSPEGLEVFGVYPRMRLAGEALALEVDEPSAGRRCLVSQLNWNLHMLREPRWFSTPTPLPAESRFTLTCHYDTLGRSGATHDGDALGDEECAALLYGVPAGL